MIETTINSVFEDLIDININIDNSEAGNGNNGNNGNGNNGNGGGNTPTAAADNEVIDVKVEQPANPNNLPGVVTKKQGGFLNIFGKKGG
tara:strand:+ start:6286 stop:6552 length:267 start_codon:yes stop_codon:yes gene_type:complete